MDSLEKAELATLIHHIGRFLKSRIPIYNSKVPNMAGRKTRRRRKRRTQAVAKSYMFHTNTIKKIIGNRNITTNIFRVQAYNSVTCVYFCIGFIDFMLKGKSLLEYTDLFLPNNYKKNNKIILNIFKKG